MVRQVPIKLVDDTAMYASEAKIYPREIDGRFQRLRLAAVWLLLALCYRTGTISLQLKATICGGVQLAIYQYGPTERWSVEIAGFGAVP